MDEVRLPRRGDRWSDEVAYHLGIMVLFAREGLLVAVYPELYVTMLQLLTLEMLAKSIRE
jgi:hypothetical protein